MGPAALLLGSLALGALALPKRRSSGGSSPTSSAGSWSLERPDIQLSPQAVAFLNKLAARVSFPIVVTSGIRTAHSQAQAMWDKANGGEDLYQLYADHTLLGEIMEAFEPGVMLESASVDAMADVITGQLARGDVISVHLTGDAIDIRINGLSADQQDEQLNAAIALGAEKPHPESNHLHLEHLSHA